MSYVVELTRQQKEHLVKFFYSGDLLPTLDGFVFRDDSSRADMRTVKALFRRGLVEMPGGDYFPGRGGMVATRIAITSEGEAIAKALENRK
jgi:hypothetical protein